ncbi:hypothetical protein [Halocynthiibacter styelae]|uniref:Uncharacterized protein n=1 Tax=Halocynthiibacter styelae TaxID=2761955 RepID=A0A8J7LP02_9RHOB|nr:hypothetical protein [Paenihalocynthiibacter styelae]MBI1492137.1 hypothetical protein [Paenihalocynthiibacter styelae]
MAFNIFCTVFVVSCADGLSRRVLGEHFSLGFAAQSAEGAFYCRDLLSSGSDDGAMVFIFKIMAVPFTLRFLLFGERPYVIEVGVFALSVALVIGAMFLASLDCAQVFYTAFVLPDVLLAVALVSLAGAVWSIYRHWV